MSSAEKFATHIITDLHSECLVLKASYTEIQQTNKKKDRNNKRYFLRLLLFSCFLDTQIIRKKNVLN